MKCDTSPSTVTVYYIHITHALDPGPHFLGGGGGGGFLAAGGGGGFFLGDDIGGGGGFFFGGEGGGFRTGAGDDDAVSPSSVARTAASHESSVRSNRVSFSLTRASLLRVALSKSLRNFVIVSKFNCTISTSSRLSQSAWMLATVRRVAASMGGGSSSFLPIFVKAPRGAGPGTPVVQSCRSLRGDG